jgi:hypothetical protein
MVGTGCGEERRGELVVVGYTSKECTGLVTRE